MLLFCLSFCQHHLPLAVFTLSWSGWLSAVGLDGPQLFFWWLSKISPAHSCTCQLYLLLRHCSSRNLKDRCSCLTASQCGCAGMPGPIRTECPLPHLKAHLRWQPAVCRGRLVSQFHKRFPKQIRIYHNIKEYKGNNWRYSWNGEPGRTAFRDNQSFKEKVKLSN